MSLRVVHIVSSLKVGGMEHFVVRLAARQSAGPNPVPNPPPPTPRVPGFPHREGGGDAHCLPRAEGASVHVEQGWTDAPHPIIPAEGGRERLSASIMALQGGPLREEAARQHVETDVLGGRSRVLRVFKAIAALHRLKPDIVHGHNPTSLQYALLAQRYTRAKVVITCHGRGKADYREPAPKLWARVDRVVCVSEAVARDAPQAVAANRLCVIRNGVDAPSPPLTREAVRASLGLSDAFTAIIVARIDALKGHETLLRAWATLGSRQSAVGNREPATTDQRPTTSNQLPATSYQLLIVGDGPERGAMERLAGELGITEGVRFLGFRSDVSDLLAAADLFVLPSLSEGLPLSVLEAMSHGLPIVATDVGGIPELVTEEEGLLVQPKDVAGLSAAIARMAACPQLRETLGENARRRVETGFSFEAMLRQYDAVYRSLLDRP